MSKKMWFAFLLTVLLSFNLISKENSKHWIFVNSGISFPVTPDDFTGYKKAFDMGGGFGLNLSPRVSLVGNLHYKRFVHKEKTTWFPKNDGEQVRYKASVFSFFCDLRFNLNRKPRSLYPYFFAGAGVMVIDRVGGYLYHVDHSGTIEGTTIHFGLGGGAGLNFKINKRSNLFVESRYTAIFFIENEGNIIGYIPIRLGISFNL